MDQWINSGTLSEDKAYSGYGSSESWGLVMAGGSSTVRLSSVETTYDGETFGALPDIPIENREFCLVVIDTDRIFTCGGRWTPTDTLIFTNSTGSWTRYRATIQVVTNLPLTPKQMLRFSISSSYKNGTFVLVSTGGLSQPEWSPCT